MTLDKPGAWAGAAAADDADVASLERRAPIRLPAEYLAFLRQSNGGEGELTVQPYWLIVWPAEDVLPLNRRYGVEENVPGFFAIGSSGGGEMIAFEMGQGEACPVVMIPFVPMQASEARRVAESFAGLLRLLGPADLD